MKTAILAVTVALATPLAMRAMVRAYALPWPHFEELNVSPRGLQDTSIILAGFRRTAADLAWVQLMEYLGRNDEFLDYRLDPLKSLKGMTLRIIRIDPYFRPAYLFAAGILAWSPSVNRPDDALEILREGIRYSPTYWPFRNYAEAILYKEKGRFSDMALLLERGIQDPDCPSMTKSILANYYKSQKRYADAIRVWQSVLSSPQDSDAYGQARQQIRLLTHMR